MPMYSTESRIKSSKSIATLIGIIVPATIMSITPGFEPERHPFTYYFRLVCLVLCTLAVLFVLYHALRQTGRLKWGDDILIVRSRSIAAQEIKSISIDGPLVGILPKGRVIVPVNLCFRFIENGEQGMKQLVGWAEDHEIELKHKRFLKWM